MKKQFLIILVLLLTAVAVTATVLNNTKKTMAPKKEKCTVTKPDCSAKRSSCPLSSIVCY